jgi:hypothetical protein
MSFPKDYAEKIRARVGKSKVYSQHQLIGLELARILDDMTHKSLYIRLAKNRDQQMLLSIAKDIADRSNVRNMGAYFMIVIKKK